MKQQKLLILGGAGVHCKLVEAARRLGVYTIVTDNLPDSPAKQLADEHLMYDIYDVARIVNYCREAGVSGVLSTHLDPCQRPYQQICQALGLPCFGNGEQFFRLTDKHAFKRLCREHGVDVTEEFTEADIASGEAEYPLFIKPVDSRGSRGQSVCRDARQARQAIAFARSESSNGDILIEKYMADAPEVQVTYYFIDGQPYLVRTVDSCRGAKELGLEKVVMCAVSPSRYTGQYLAGAHKRVTAMLKALGLRNGPAFLQGFYDNGKFRFFDPGLRFPGVDYERIYARVFGIDLTEEAVRFALGMAPGVRSLRQDSALLDGRCAAVLFPVIRAGRIAAIRGEDLLRADPRVISWLNRHTVGEQVGWSADVNQRLAEIDVLCDDMQSLRQLVADISDTLQVYDEDGAQLCLPLKEIVF